MSMEVIRETAIVSKRKRQKKIFELLNTHAIRRFEELDKYRLLVPVDEYQRDESAGRIASDIAIHFDMVALGALTVIERMNRQLIVADGGTRLAGALQRDDVATLPCLVFSGLTAKEEADVFLRINLMRRKLKTEQQHHAELFSGEDLATKTQQFIDRLHESRVSLASLSTMRSVVKRDYRATGTIIGILLQVAVDKHVTARVMKGLVRLESILMKEDKTLNRRPVIRKMQAKFGQFDAVINVTVEPRQHGDQNGFARALARTLNIKFPRV